MNIKEVTMGMWNSKYTFTPVLLDREFGDGGKIAIFETMNDRPLYWLVKVDSKTDFDNDDNLELLNEVWSEIESEYGERFEHYDENGYELKDPIEHDYPACSSDSGSSLGDITDDYLEELSK